MCGSCLSRPPEVVAAWLLTYTRAVAVAAKSFLAVLPALARSSGATALAGDSDFAILWLQVRPSVTTFATPFPVCCRCLALPPNIQYVRKILRLFNRFGHLRYSRGCRCCGA